MHKMAVLNGVPLQPLNIHFLANDTNMFIMQGRIQGFSRGGGQNSTHVKNLNFGDFLPLPPWRPSGKTLLGTGPDLFYKNQFLR